MQCQSGALASFLENSWQIIQVKHRTKSKGSAMSAILSLLTAAALILFGLFRKRHPAEKTEAVIVRRYVHPGHGWLRMTEDGDVIVGMDDFAQSIAGSIDQVKLPRLLHRVEQGGIAWTLLHGQRCIPMVSPVSGRVIEKNEMVIHDPSLINRSPYGDGWLFKVRPRRISVQLHNLLSGRSAQQWQDAVRAQLSAFFSGTPALMYQDGGVMMSNLADRCSDDEWRRLLKQFLLIDESTPHFS